MKPCIAVFVGVAIASTALSSTGLSQTLGADSLRADSSVFFYNLPYFTAENDTLWLDYYPAAVPTDAPTILFVHGGGFYTGTYRNFSISSYCDSLRQWGYNVASMQYHLHLQGQDFHCNQPIANKIRAVEVCVRDIHRASAYLTAPKDSVLTPANGVVLIGSSAGAEAALHAVYWSKDRPFLESSPFPTDSVGYRGVVAFAGALEDTTLVVRENVLPTALFHGTCDPLVPFETDIHHYCPERTPGAWILHGSKSIADQLKRLDASYYLHVACGLGHEVAGRPMVQQIAETVLFIRTAVERSARQQTTVVVPGTSDCPETSYGPCLQPTIPSRD